MDDRILAIIAISLAILALGLSVSGVRTIPIHEMGSTSCIISIGFHSCNALANFPVNFPRIPNVTSTIANANMSFIGNTANVNRANPSGSIFFYAGLPNQWHIQSNAICTGAPDVCDLFNSNGYTIIQDGIPFTGSAQFGMNCANSTEPMSAIIEVQYSQVWPSPIWFQLIPTIPVTANCSVASTFTQFTSSVVSVGTVKAWRMNSDQGNVSTSVLMNNAFINLQSNIPVDFNCTANPISYLVSRATIQILCNLDLKIQSRFVIKWEAILCNPSKISNSNGSQC